MKGSIGRRAGRALIAVEQSIFYLASDYDFSSRVWAFERRKEITSAKWALDPSSSTAMNVWTEHRNPEGRTYWFNTGTRESVWEKPDGTPDITIYILVLTSPLDLKTPFEVCPTFRWKA